MWFIVSPSAISEKSIVVHEAITKLEWNLHTMTQQHAKHDYDLTYENVWRALITTTFS